MHALPLLLASLIAALLAPFALRTLRAGGHVRANFRGRALPVPLGVLILTASLLALVPLVVIERVVSAEVFESQLVLVLVYALGVACLGLIDDAYGAAGPDGMGDGLGGRGVEDGAVEADAVEDAVEEDAVEGGGRLAPRGWRGHTRAVLRGELSTGALKAGGSLGLALVLMSFAERSTGMWLLASAVLVLTTNLFNLLDLRPGRAVKAFVLLGAGLTAGSGVLGLWALGLFAGPALVAGVYDVRERAMLGDTGANLLGALAGLWLVLALSTLGLEIALALLLLITVYGEFRSISALVEKTPGVRWLDSLGRPS